MYEIQKLVSELIGALALLDITQFILPQVGVGGGVEAKEHVELLPILKFTLIFLAGVGTVFGLGLAFAAKKFAVQIDPNTKKMILMK